MTTSEGEKVLCYRYNGQGDPKVKKEFLLGYPIINFFAGDTNHTLQKFQWFPSEYLYLESDNRKYCLTADREGSSQITFGSTLMRQNDFIFDVKNKQIGIARSKCNDEQTMILTEQDYVDYGTSYGIDLSIFPEKT